MKNYTYLIALMLCAGTMHAAELIRPVPQTVKPVRPTTRPALISEPTWSSQATPVTKPQVSQGFVAPELTECLNKGFNVYECQQQLNKTDGQQAPQVLDNADLPLLDDATKYY